MLWLRIVVGLVFLLVATFLLQWLLPRGKSKRASRSRLLRWDIAPTVGFFGAVLLGLSFAAASQHAAILEWTWGVVLGLVLGIVAWIMNGYRRVTPAARRPSLWGRVQQYGKAAIALAVGLYLSVRVLGLALEVFSAAVVGMLVLAAAVALFVGNKPIPEEENVK
jgi:hypothetical protein